LVNQVLIYIFLIVVVAAVDKVDNLQKPLKTSLFPVDELV
jgi:hypothetical protein